VDEAVDLVAGAEPGDAGPDRLDLPGQVAAEHAIRRPAQAEGAHDVGQAAQEVPVARVDGGGADPHQHLAVPGHGLVDLLEPELLGRAVAVVGDRLHVISSTRRGAVYAAHPPGRAA
jgi:hypothetical protein